MLLRHIPKNLRCFRAYAVALALAAALAVAACAGENPAPTPAQTSGASTPEAEPLQVAATSNIVADWARNVGGDSVEVFSIAPPGADPHSFQPGAKDIARIADADLVLSVGLGLEESWLHELLENAARDPEAIVELGELIDPIEFSESHAEEVDFLDAVSGVVHEVEEGEIDAAVALEEVRELLANAEDDGDEDEPLATIRAILAQVDGGQMDTGDAIEEIEAIAGEGEEAHEGHGHGLEDPHFWFDPIRVKTAVNEIASRFSALNPARSDTFSANAAAYNAGLDQLHTWTEEQVALVPEERRLLLTSHDSFGYFANRYGFEVVGVILGVTTETEPSAEHLAELIEEVEEEAAPAVFGETTASERLAATVAEETGAKFIRLYSGSLGPADSEAATYVDMARTNVERIVDALK